MFRASRPNSNFLTFSESFYIKRYKNIGYRYHLGGEDTSPPTTHSRESKVERKERFTKLMMENNWTRAELSRHLGVSRAWISKVLKHYTCLYLFNISICIVAILSNYLYFCYV